MKPKDHKLLLWVTGVAVLLLLHALLLCWFAEKQVVATLLSAGGDMPRQRLALVVLFLGVRLLAVFFLPGLVLSRLGIFFFDRWLEKRETPTAEKSSGADSASPS